MQKQRRNIHRYKKARDIGIGISIGTAIGINNGRDQQKHQKVIGIRIGVSRKV